MDQEAPSGPPVGFEVARHDLGATTPFVCCGRRWASVRSWVNAPPGDPAGSLVDIGAVVAARYSQHVELFADLMAASDGDLAEVAASAMVEVDEVLTGLHHLRRAATACLGGLRSAEEVESAAVSADVTARVAAVQHPWLGRERLRSLGDDPAPAVRAIAVRRLDPQTAARRCDDPDRFVRRALAARDDLDADVLDTLSRDRDLGVRHQVAKNPRCSPGTLERLALDPSELVRNRAARSLERRDRADRHVHDRESAWGDPFGSVFTLQFFPFDSEGLVFRLDPNVFGAYPYEVDLEELPVLDQLCTRVERVLDGIRNVDEDVPPLLDALVEGLIDDMASELARVPGWRLVVSRRR